MRTLICLILVIGLAGCGESKAERQARLLEEKKAQEAEHRKKLADEELQRKKAAEAKRKKAEEEAKRLAEKAREEREKAAREREKQMAEEREKQRQRELELERSRPRSIDEMPPEDRERFNTLFGYRFGSTLDEIPDADPHDPVPYTKTVRLDSPIDIFTNAEAKLVYTPIGKKLAYIHVRVEKKAEKGDYWKEDKRMPKVLDALYGTELYIFPKEVDWSTFRFRSSERVIYEKGDRGVQDREPDGYCHCIDGKVFTLNYSYDEDKGIAKYVFYGIETNLLAKINKEAKELQDAAIDAEMRKTESGKLDSFCGVKIRGVVSDVNTSWETLEIPKVGLVTNGEGTVSVTPHGYGAPGKDNVTCNKFRVFRQRCSVSITPQSKEIFRINLESDNEEMSDLCDRGLAEKEFLACEKALQERYDVKPFRLVYDSKYRIFSARTTRSERMFVLGRRCIYLIDFLEMDSRILLRFLDYEGADKAISESKEMKESMRHAQSERLFAKGPLSESTLAKQNIPIKGVSDFFGYSFGQSFPNKRDWCVGRNKRKATVELSHYENRSFRGLDSIDLSLTWKSYVLFGITLRGDRLRWAGFSRIEEAENILNMLIEHYKMQPTREETDYGFKYTFRIEDSVIELRCDPNGAIELEAKNLMLEKLSLKELEEENKAIMSRDSGKSAL